MQAAARSLGRANQELQAENGTLAYVVTDLTVSIPATDVQVDEDSGLSVDYKDTETGDRFVRFRVLSLPDTRPEAESPGKGEKLPDIRAKTLEESVAALGAAGFSTEDIRVRFEPASRGAPGRVIGVQLKERAAPTKRRQVVITVAGPEPATSGTGMPRLPRRRTAGGGTPPTTKRANKKATKKKGTKKSP